MTITTAERPAALEPVREADFTAAWLASLRSEHTRAAYLADMRAFAAYLAEHDTPLTTVRRAHVDLWARVMETHLRPATVARRLAAVGSFFRYAVEEGHLDVNPTERVARPRVHIDDQQVTPARTRAEVTALLDVAIHPRDRALVLVLVAMGLRISEALALDLDALEPDRGHQTVVVHGKGNRHTRAVVPPLVIAALEAITEAEGRTSGPVFARDGIRWNRAQAARALRRLGRAAHLDGTLRPHQLRATAITMALELGAPLDRVQTFARHASPLTTRRYDANRLGLDNSPAYLLAAEIAS